MWDHHRCVHKWRHRSERWMGIMFRMAKGFLEVPPNTSQWNMPSTSQKDSVASLFWLHFHANPCPYRSTPSPSFGNQQDPNTGNKTDKTPPAPQPTKSPFLPMLNSLGRGLAISRLTWHSKSICHESAERKAELRSCVCFLPLLPAPFLQVFSLLSLL